MEGMEGERSTKSHWQEPHRIVPCRNNKQASYILSSTYRLELLVGGWWAVLVDRHALWLVDEMSILVRCSSGLLFCRLGVAACLCEWAQYEVKGVCETWWQCLMLASGASG